MIKGNSWRLIKNWLSIKKRLRKNYLGMKKKKLIKESCKKLKMKRELTKEKISMISKLEEPLTLGQ
jgi:hypothetical protein